MLNKTQFVAHPNYTYLCTPPCPCSGSVTVNLDVKQSVKHIVRINNVICMDILSYSLITKEQDAWEEHGTFLEPAISYNKFALSN